MGECCAIHLKRNPQRNWKEMIQKIMIYSPWILQRIEFNKPLSVGNISWRQNNLVNMQANGCKSIKQIFESLQINTNSLKFKSNNESVRFLWMRERNNADSTSFKAQPLRCSPCICIISFEYAYAN